MTHLHTVFIAPRYLLINALCVTSTYLGVKVNVEPLDLRGAGCGGGGCAVVQHILQQEHRLQGPPVGQAQV
jgi:hypothetical protein